MKIVAFIFRNKKELFKWSAIAVFVLLGFLAGRLSRLSQAGTSLSYDVKPVREGGFSLINPILFYDASGTEPLEYYALKKALSQNIDGDIKNGKASRISLYFRDLTTWGWININPDEKFSPASLLKVPTMISILRYAESHPGLLSKNVLYNGSFDYNKTETIKPLKQLRAGSSYTVDELLQYMIVYSDNNAAALLHLQIDQNLFYEAFTDLGLSTPFNNTSTTVDNFDYMTPKSYASFFRVLYNSTYLSREMSEKALDLLLGSDFPQGIESGIPAGIKAAQKFGERTVLDTEGNVISLELHDCGIVYYPQRPYLLCIMTAGSNFIDLTNVISDLSLTTYDEIKNL